METLQSPLARGGTIRRSGTRKGANGVPKRVKGYDNVHQSLKQLHPAEDKEGERSDMELVQSHLRRNVAIRADDFQSCVCTRVRRASRGELAI